MFPVCAESHHVPCDGGEVGLSSPSLTSFREDTPELFRRATTWVCLHSSRIGTISLNSGLSCEKKSGPTQQHSNLSYKQEMFERHKCPPGAKFKRAAYVQ